jgi:hypothetical protein
VPATSRRNYQEEGMMEFWGNSGTEGAGESRKAVARPFEGRCMTYGVEFCGKNEEGNDLDRFADLVSLVALVRLVEPGGRKDGEGPCRKSEGFSQSKVKGQRSKVKSQRSKVTNS